MSKIVDEDEKARMRVAIEHMRCKGLLLSWSSSASPIPPDVEPVEVEGTPLSEVIIEERR